MTIRPFAPGSLASQRSADLFVSMRGQLSDLQRQIATGQKADSYGGLGFDRGVSLNFRAKLTTIEGYYDVIQGADLRVKLMTQGLEQLDKIARDTKAALQPPKFELGPNGQTQVQRTAEENLKLAIDILNQEVNGRYLFAARATDTRPVADLETILNGDATGLGLRDYIQQRIAEGSAADASEASMDFFDGVPLLGPPPPLAPALTSPVAWYKGDLVGGSLTSLDADPSQARATSAIQVDAMQTIGTGAAAHEPALRGVLAQLGALAATTFTTTPAEKTRYETLATSVRAALTPPNGSQKVSDVVVELGNAAAAMQGAKERHQATEALLQGEVDGIEVAEEEVYMRILVLQTQLQASYQTTSMLSRLSLVNYL